MASPGWRSVTRQHKSCSRLLPRTGWQAILLLYIQSTHHQDLVVADDAVVPGMVTMLCALGEHDLLEAVVQVARLAVGLACKRRQSRSQDFHGSRRKW